MKSFLLKVLDKGLTILTGLALSLLIYFLGTMLIVSLALTVLFPFFFVWFGFGFAFGISFAGLCVFFTFIVFSYLIYQAILKVL